MSFWHTFSIYLANDTPITRMCILQIGKNVNIHIRDTQQNKWKLDIGLYYMILRLTYSWYWILELHYQDLPVFHELILDKSHINDMWVFVEEPSHKLVNLPGI